MPDVQPLPLAREGAFRLRDPEITLDGIPVESTGINWSLVPGPDPHVTSFRIRRDRLKGFWPPAPIANGPQAGQIAWKTLSMKVQSIIAGQVIDFDHRWRGIYVIDAYPLDRENAEIVIADRRFLWQGITRSGMFNVPARRNDASTPEGVASPDVPGQSAGKVRFGVVQGRRGDILIGNYISKALISPALRYRQWSLKRNLNRTAGIGQQNAFGGGDSEFIPWTALDIVLAVLVGREVYSAFDEDGNFAESWTWEEGIVGNSLVIADKLFELASDYCPDRTIFNCRPVADILREMMALARVNLFVRPDNAVVLYPIDDDDATNARIPGGVKGATDDGTLLVDGSGFLRRVDNMAKRPARVVVCFDMEREKDLTVVGGSESAPAVAVNVMELHTARELSVDGETRVWQPGTYPPVSAVLEAYGIAVADINQHWYLQGRLAEKVKELLGLPRTLPDVEVDGLVASLLAHYRQTFRPLDQYVDVMLSMQAVLAAVLNQHGLRAPSPVWCRYTVVPGFRTAKDIDEEASVSGWVVNATDVTGVQAPFLVQVLDAELGIFRVTPREDSQNGSVYLSIPCGVDESVPLPPPHLTADGADWGNVPLEENFRLTTRMTFRWASPNSEDRFFKVDIPAESVTADAPALGPVFTIYTDRDTARVDKDGTLINEGIIKAIAASEARRIYLSWRNRWATSQGGLRFAGGHKLVPWGPVSEVSWEWVDGELTTIVAMDAPPAPPRAQQLTDRRIQFFLERRPPIQ